MTTKEEKNNFSMMIEDRASKLGTTHLEVIMDYCESTGLEPEVAAVLVNQSLKSKLEDEARDLRFLPKGSKLPI